MRLIIKIIIVISVFSFTYLGRAQSLQSFISKALEANYQIKIVKNDLIRAELYNTPGNAGQLPTVSLDGGLSSSFNNTYLLFADGSEQQGNNAQTTNLNIGIMANWTIFKGFSIMAQKDLLAQLVSLGELNSSYYIEQTVSDIIASYYAIAYQKSLLNSYEASMKISGFRYALELERKRIGSGDFKAYGQAYYDYHLDSINWLKQQSLIESLTIELNRITNSDLNENISIEANFNMQVSFNKDTLIAEVKNQNVALDRSLLNEKIQTTELRMQQAARYPTIDIFAGYQVGSSVAEVGFVKQNRNFGPQFGIAISYDLFNGGKTNTAIKDAELSVENMELETEDVSLKLTANVLKLYQEYVSLLKQKTIAENSVFVMKRVMEIAESELKEGRINGYDFRQSQISRLKAEQNLIQITYALKLIEINLDQLRGIVLEKYLN